MPGVSRHSPPLMQLCARCGRSSCSHLVEISVAFHKSNPRKSNRWIAETNGCTNARRFGAIRTELGNLCLRKTTWWGWEDSNFQPNDYQPPALSIEHSGAVS
jgi:hypothetical protein